MQHVGGLMPDEDSEVVWGEKVDSLGRLIEQGDDAAVLSWFDREVPRLMCLVPNRRRGRLLEGMYEAVEAHGDVCFEL